MAQRKLLFKVIVVGDGGVGKSTMIQRLLTGNFVPMKITIGTDLATFDVNINEDVGVKLQIWDFAGEKRFRFFLPNYSRGAMGVVFCYDITRYTSFENLEEWFEIIKQNAPNATTILVGGKLDMDDKRVVMRNDAEEFQKAHDINYFFEASSKSGQNNQMIFQTLSEAIFERL